MNTLRVLSRFKREANATAQTHGYRLRAPVTRLARFYDDDTVAVIRKVGGFTMTTPERVIALRDAIAYIQAAEIPGAIVECGVWRGGSMMAAAHELLRAGTTDRELWLYDTFTGMTEPTVHDNTVDGRDGQAWFDAEVARPEAESSGVTGVPLDVVRANLASTGYPTDKTFFVAGPVEQTLSDTRPGSIALLRLDTDFYESTRAELEHLYPLLAPGGVLFVDDYGYWLGARKAVDEYFATDAVFMHRIDQSARTIIKPR